MLRRAKRRCVVELVITQVDGNDRTRSGQRGALHDIEPDATATDDEQLDPAGNRAWRITAPIPAATPHLMIAAQAKAGRGGP